MIVDTFDTNCLSHSLLRLSIHSLWLTWAQLCFEIKFRLIVSKLFTNDFIPAADTELMCMSWPSFLNTSFQCQIIEAHSITSTGSGALNISYPDYPNVHSFISPPVVVDVSSVSDKPQCYPILAFWVAFAARKFLKMLFQ